MQQFKTISIDPATHDKLVEISQTRKANGNLICSQKNIITDFINKLHKREVENEKKQA